MTQKQFETLLDRHGNDIFGFCCYLTGSRGLAEDLYQDSVLKAFELIGRIDGNSENGLRSAKNYIIGIAVKLHRNLMRKKSVTDSFFISGGEMVLNSVADNMNVAAEMERKTEEAAVRRIVSGLPEKLRVVVYMFYYAEMSVNDIAQQLEIPSGTVKSRLNKARKTIKMKLLEEDEYEKD